MLGAQKVFLVKGDGVNLNNSQLTLEGPELLMVADGKGLHLE